MREIATYPEMLIEIGEKQAIMCNNDGFNYINCLVTCAGMRELMKAVYCVLVATKKLTVIEKLPDEEKQSLWLQTKEFSKDMLELEDEIKLSKCLYALEYFLNK